MEILEYKKRVAVVISITLFEKIVPDSKKKKKRVALRGTGLSDRLATMTTIRFPSERKYTVRIPRSARTDWSVLAAPSNRGGVYL